VVSAVRRDRTRSTAIVQDLRGRIEEIESYIAVAEGSVRDASRFPYVTQFLEEHGAALAADIRLFASLGSEFKRSGHNFNYSVVGFYEAVRARAATIGLARWLPPVRAHDAPPAYSQADAG
jgi:hypothetical protein